MDTININLNGTDYKVPAGITIMDAAKKNGIKIPHLCHAGYLEPSSACRMCVVEVAGAKALVTACSAKVADGMKVQTHSERVLRSRKSIIELLLSAHPADCLTCEQSGACKLQKYAYELGIKESPYPWAEKYDYNIIDDNPFYYRDYNKCILCGRCVRTCAEVQGDHIIDFAHRGFASMISTPLDRDLESSGCVFCGNCVESCPVGALIPKKATGAGRDWEFEKVKTICPYCGCGCTLELHVKDGKVVKTSSSKHAPVNGMALCVKGRFGLDFIHHKDRLTQPLLKQADGSFNPISWDEAIALVAERINSIKAAHGPDAIAGFASAKCTNEENYVFQKMMRAAVGTNNVDHCARLCHASTVTGLSMSFGSGAMTNPISDLEHSDVIIVSGSNTTEAHPIVGLSIKKAVKRGAKLIVVEPRKIGLTNIADMHLRQKSGTDVAWMNGMMNVIISEGLANTEFIEARTEDFDKVRELVKKYTPEYVEGITGIPAEELRMAARVYGKAERGAIVYAMGLTQHTTGTDNVLSVSNLAMLTGNVGRKGTGVYPLRGQNNVQGSCDMGALPDSFPGYQKVENPEILAKFEKAWGVKLPAKNGLTVVEVIHEAIRGEIKALIVMGENPMLSDPDLQHVEEGLRKLDFLVVQDIFMTETAKLAHLVLPAVTFAEKDGTFVNTERRIQRVRKAIDPVGDSRQDWEIVSQISTALGFPMKYRDPAAIMQEIAGLVPQYGGVDFVRIEGNGLCWPCKTPQDPGTPILHQTTFTRGKGKFHAVEFIVPSESPDKDYPLILTTGRMLYHYHTGSMTRRVDAIHEHRPTGYVEVNPADAARIGLANGSKAKVSTRRGEILIDVHVDEVVPVGTVFIPFHFNECAANMLTNTALDPYAKIPEFKVCAVHVAPA